MTVRNLIKSFRIHMSLINLILKIIVFIFDTEKKPEAINGDSKADPPAE